MVKFKLPYELNLKLEELRDADSEWKLTTLRKAINKLISARERSNENYKLNRGYEAPSERLLEYFGEVLLSRDIKINCVYCGMSNWADECQKYKTLQQRKSRMNGRCFICLSPNHFCRDCKSDRACFYCKRKKSHHSSLCPRKFGSGFSENEATVESNGGSG